MIILERFEDDTAVLEIDGKIEKISRSKISSDVSEGDVLIQKDGIFMADKENTEKRKKEIIRLQNSLWG